MYTSAMYAWGWLKQLKRMQEQKFGKSTEPMDFTKQKDHHKSHYVVWTFSDLVFVTTCFQIDIIYLSNMGYMLKNDHNPGFLQIMIMYATWGPALIYMEIFLGQYVQRGCLYLKNISPLTCSSIGFAMLSTAYCYSVASVGRLADSYMFLFRSFSSELPWMVCPKGSTPATCIDRALLVACYLENRQDNCYPKLGPELLSSRIYYKNTHSSFANRVVLLLFGWFTIYIALKRTLGDTRIIVKRLLLFMLILFLCLLTPLLIHVSRGLSVVPFFSLRQGAVLSIGTWMTAFKNFLRDHAAARGCWQLIGSHTKRGPSAANLTIYCCALTYMVTVFSQVFSTGILGVLLFYMKVTHVDEELYFPRYAKLFNFYPFALGMLQVRQVWSLIFFTLIALSSISYTVVNMAILEDSMYDDFPVLRRYRGYVKVMICILGFFVGIISNLLTGASSYEDEVVLQIAFHLTKIVILFLTFSVGYIYGMERFSDDMNFLNGSQPTTYWKICWKSLPFGILILLGRDMIAIKFSRRDLVEMTSNIIYVVLLSLAVLRLIYQIAMSIKARNVVGILFQATPLWGPPLPEDRRLRNTYNPREETKYWRKNNLCTHHCLLNKDFILSVIFSEIESRTSTARNNDTSQHDFKATVPKQSKQNQVVIAIDKVSSAQLETFEEQVKQRMKYLTQLEEAEVSVDRREAIAPTKRIKATKSMEELNYQVDQMIRRVTLKSELEKGNDSTKVQKTTSRTKQRRPPTFVPRETPRPKKTLMDASTAEHKDTRGTESAKVHTYAVQVPHFVLKPSEKILPRPEIPKTAQKKLGEDLEASKSPPSAALRGSKSSSCRESRRTFFRKPRLAQRKPRLPVWPLPLDTPRPIVASRLSRSSSSTSTESMEVHRQPSSYFLNVRLPPKANLPLPAFSIELHSPPRSSRSYSASSEQAVLNHDPVLREILRSVHPELYPTVRRDSPRVSSRHYAIDHDILRSNRREASVPQPQPRTSIAGRSPLISSTVGSPRPLPRKKRSMDPPVPSPRPRPIRNKRSPCETASQQKPQGAVAESAVDIDQAIQIRINNLLRGIQDPGRSTDHRRGGSSAVAVAKDGLKTRETSENVSRPSKAKKKLDDQSQATKLVALKISAFGKRIAKRMTRGTTPSRISKVLQITDESDKPWETTIREETLEETTPKLNLTGCEEPKQPSSSMKHERERSNEEE